MGFCFALPLPSALPLPAAPGALLPLLAVVEKMDHKD